MNTKQVLLQIEVPVGTLCCDVECENVCMYLSDGFSECDLSMRPTKQSDGSIQKSLMCMDLREVPDEDDG